MKRSITIVRVAGPLLRIAGRSHLAPGREMFLDFVLDEKND
jgi:hypothetical protein